MVIKEIKIIFLISLLLGLVFVNSARAVDCGLEYEKNRNCPDDMCIMQCKGGVVVDGCQLDCEPAPCVSISEENCPLDRCDVLEGCDKGKKVCYYKAAVPSECGDLGYAGPEKCCEGYEKRCGFAFFDGSCDMIGAQSIYSAPICIPCGNGVCNQFEDVCNCPEDCKE